MPQRPTIFTLVQGEAPDNILEKLASWPDLHAKPAASYRRIYFDSFDWRLHSIGASLSLRIAERQARRLELVCEPDDFSCGLPGRAQPGFVWDLPDGPLKSKLEPVLEMRRLLPLVEVSIQSTPYLLLDEEEKTVARLYFERILASSKAGTGNVALLPRICVTPVRGYTRAFSELLARVGELPLMTTRETLQSTSLAAFGRREGDYSGKIQTALEPQQEAGDALTQILRDLLLTIRVNEEGTQKHLDSEFLHDFRVAVRRTRSAVSQLKRLLPEDACAHFRKEFSWLGSATGPTRDLDVYLLKFPHYQSALPPQVRANLLPLRDFLERLRRQEQKKLSRVLRSARYRKLLDDWQAFLDDRMQPATSMASLPIIDIASQRLRKAAKRVLQGGEQIRDESPASELHTLRIEGKKLRYLMEFFRTLYPRKQIDGLIRSLKILQDNLGDFNDYVVQRAALLDFAKQMAEADRAHAQTLMGMGRLVARLEKGQEEERIRFQACFESFSTQENRRLIKRLFHSEAKTA